MKEKRQDYLSPNLQKYYEARQEMNDWLEKDDVPEDTKATMYSQQLQRVNPIRPRGAQRPGWPNSQLLIRNLLSYDAQTW